MKKSTRFSLLLFMLMLFCSICKGALSEAYYKWNKQIKTISINISNCSVEILPSSNNYLTYCTSGHVILNTKFLDNTLITELSSDSLTGEILPTAYLSMPITEQHTLKIHTVHANASLYCTFSDISIKSDKLSYIHIRMSNLVAQNIHAELTDKSHILCEYPTDSANFRMDCIILDPESHLDIDGKYTDLSGKGEYHYIKGDNNTKLNVILNTNSLLTLVSRSTP